MRLRGLCWLGLLAAIGCGDDAAGTRDAAVDAGVADAGPPRCLSSPSGTCSYASEYCFVELAGATAGGTDAGPPQRRGCNPLPGACQTAPTCACVLAETLFPPGGTQCMQQGAAIIVTTALP